MIYVLEATAIAEIFVMRPSALATERLTELVEQGIATFPDDVTRELRQHYEGEACYAWAFGVRKARLDPGVPWDLKMNVLARARDLVDENNPREQCAPAVIGLALAVLEYASASVVTADIGDKPGRTSISVGCERLGVPWVDPGDFIARTDWP